MESLILEQQPSALGAYSTRILRRDYQRALMRVRRGGDNAQADVRADSNGVISLDSRVKIASGTSAATTLGEFVASPSYTDVDSLGSSEAATVSIWYDQGPSNNHMTQVVTNYQPRIVSTSGNVYQGDNGPQVLFFPSTPNEKFMDLRELVGDFTVYLSFRLLASSASIKLYDDTNDLIDISRSSNDITLSQITNSDLHLNGYNKGDSTSVDFDSQSDNTLTVSGTFASTGSAKIGTGLSGLSDFYIYPKAKKAKKRREIEVVTTREKEAPLSYSNRGDIDTTAFLNKFEGAANAFSLRSLNKEGSNPLITVRREIDHKEAFVFPDASGFVSLSSLVSESSRTTTGIAPGPHLSVPPTKATTLGQFMGDASSSDPDSLGSPTTGRVVTMFDQVSANETLRRRLLDYHTGSEAAYSTKRLSTSYTGPCFEVSLFSSVSPYNLISSSDINFDSSGSVSQTFSAFRSQALQTHGASTIIRASKIYDQSGNGRHLTQSSRDEMPGILLNTKNGEVGFQFSASSGSYRHSMSVSSLSIPTPFSYSTSFYRGTGIVDGYKYIDFGGSVSIQSGSAAELSVSDGSNSIEPSGFMPQNVVNHVYGVHDGASSEFGYNGSVTSGSGLTSSITSIQINESGQSASVDVMYFHELIVWGENKSVDQGQKEDIDLYSQEVYRNEDANAKALASTAQPKIYDATNGLVQDGGSVALEVVQGNYFLFDKSKMSGKSNVSSFVSFSTDDVRGYLYALSASYHGPRMHISVSAPYVSNLGTPSSFIDGEEETISNSIQSYGLLSDSTKKILSTVGADTSSWGSYSAVNEVTLFNSYQGGGTNDTFSGKFQELIFFNSDVSNDRGLIENDMNNAFNSYSSAKSLGRQKLLNEHPGAAAAYSVRQVNSNYSGPIMRVDNGYTELDIYPLINGDLDTEAIIQHANVNPFTRSAGVSVWYDQSGNGNDAAQTTNASQPLICDNGAVIYENGKPAVKFDGSDDVLFTSNTSINVGSQRNDFAVTTLFRNTFWGVFNMDDVGGGRFAQNMRGSSAAQTIGFLSTGASVNATGSTALTLNEQYLLSAELDGTNLNVYVDGSIDGTASQSTQKTGQSDLAIGSAGDTSSGRLQGYVQEVITYQSNKSTNRSDIEFNINKYFDISPQGPTKLLLDKYPGSAAAYSLRKLSAKYSGPAIKIRRASDSLEADVFFDNNGNISLESIVANVSETTTGKPQGSATFSLPVSTLGEFVGNIKYSSAGVTDAFVVVWYDQSSNGNDAQQLNAASQPKVVNAGFIVLEGKEPAVEFDGSNYFLESGAVTASSQPITVISTTTPQATAFSGGILNTTDSNNFIDFYRNDGGFAINAGTTLSSGATVDYVQDIQYVRFSLFNGANSEIFANGTSVISGNANTTGISGNLFVGKYLTSSNNFMNGLMQEVILYASDQSSNRTNIESDINSHYSIFDPELELGLINEFDGAAAAYSLRLLNYFYQGPLVRVRRDSDHVEVDVYPDENGVFSERSLVRNAVESSTGVTVGSPNDTTAFRFGEFAYGTNCFVVEWKDQSSNNNHATQDASASQPKIYDSATGVVTENGKPAVDFVNGADKSLKTGQNFTNSDTLTLYGVLEMHSTAWQAIASLCTSSNVRNELKVRDNRVYNLKGAGSTFYSNILIPLSQQTLAYGQLTASGGELAIDGGTAATTTAAYVQAVTNSSFAIGSRAHTSGESWTGTISELIMYFGTPPTRTDIEDNINTFYNIY